MKKYFWSILLFFLPLSTECLAQNGSAQEQAMRLYSEKKYTEALGCFKKLVTQYPKDPKYFYYSGICMVQTNTSIQDAEKYLLYASEYAVPRDVYFYLGKAYHYQYKFSAATDAYQKFKQFGISDDQEKQQCDMYIAMARNGQNIFNYVKIKITDKKKTDLNKIYTQYNSDLKNGQFKSKQEKSKNAKENSQTQEWRYEPFLAEKGIIIFGSTQGLLKRNRDIYQAKKGKNNQWSGKEILNTPINTPYDEDYAYFNEAENALYFASKGHNSMGGYDIFKSVYNPDYKTWSEPINLGYPINSPYNDFLFVPSDDQKMAYFASDRETSGNQVMVYKIEFEKNYTFTNIPAGFEFKNILLPDSSAKLPTQATPVVLQKTDTLPITKSAPPVNKSDNGYPKEFLQMDDYNRVVNDAMVYQLKSDSLNRMISEQRDKLDNTENETDKADLKTRIFRMDKQSKQYQHIADSMYVKAREYENKATVNKKTDTTAITADMAKNVLSKGEKKQPKVSSVDNDIPSKKTKNSEILYEFKVMSKSPYKTTAEIPLNQPLPNGIVYRIQMGAFSKTIEPDRFKGIVPISGETIENSAVTKYYAGLFSRFADAEKALNKIKEYGFKDAFIVSFYNCKSIPTNRAIELEKNN